MTDRDHKGSPLPVPVVSGAGATPREHDARPTRIIIDCPPPPSTNRLWRSKRGTNGKPQFYPDERYQDWRKVFDGYILAMRPKPRLSGPFRAFITIDRRKVRKGSDIDNRGKPILDALQKAGVIENDKLAEEVVARWGEAPEGCRIEVVAA